MTALIICSLSLARRTRLAKSVESIRGHFLPPTTLIRTGLSRAHLKDFRGTLQANAFAEYDAVYDGGDVREAACMAHAPRKFHGLFVARRNEVNTEELRPARRTGRT